MEALYAKLYDKYVKLKKDKESQFDNVNREQEVKFINYAAAADEMIQYLKSENDSLYRQVEELKSELTSIRSSSDEKHTHDQKLLMEEKRKCKELSEEIARLEKLKHIDRSRCTVDATGAEVENSSGDTPVEKTPNKPAEKLLKKRKLLHNAEVSTTEYNNEEVYLPSDTHVDQGTGLPPIIQQPVCCQTRIQISGGDATDTSSVNCMFQNLAELLVGMKVSAVYQNKEPSFIVHHKSTGYSFSLTWINNSKGEAELLYNVLSLGTFERVAPEFMKETIIFSTTSVSTEVQDLNQQKSTRTHQQDSIPSEVDEEDNLNKHCNSDQNVNEEEDDEDDVDFNPFLKESNSLEASSSLSSEVEDLNADVADSGRRPCASSVIASLEKDKDIGKYSHTSEDFQHDEEIVSQMAVSCGEVAAIDPQTTAISDTEAMLISQSETGFLCNKENGSTSIEGIHNATESNPTEDVDSEGAICMRTRARYSLASFTLDELETFLQESDDEEDLQNVDDEVEYRKFLAAVLRGDEESQNLQENANADVEDEENDADFELEIEEALDSDVEEIEERRVGRRNRFQKKTSIERNNKLTAQSSRPLRPLLPFASLGSISAFDGIYLAPNIAQPYMVHVNNSFACGFTPHQIGQLHCLIHEHVQLLVQVFSVCVIDHSKSNIAMEVKKLILEMLQKREQVLAGRANPYPSFFFVPPHVQPSVGDRLHKTIPPNVSNPNVQVDPHPKSDQGLHSHTSSSQNLLHNSWVPYISGPVLSVMDVAPLRLVGNYIDEVSSSVKAQERYRLEHGYETPYQNKPLFPLHYIACSTESDGQHDSENAPPNSVDLVSSPSTNRMRKKTMAATLLERARSQPVALVPKEIADLAQRFCPLFNPALYPHQPPPAALAKRVLFTDAEDELLALGLMEYNTDWKAIQQRFLPCKSRHQIFVRQKNRASSKAPENPIKVVRQMKNSPLTPEEIARIEVGLKKYKLDLLSVWRFLVPYRDPTLFPRQWRIACGTQKSYKSDATKRAKRRLYELRRKTNKQLYSTRHSSSEKEGDSSDNPSEETNYGGNHMDKEDEAYVHEAFLADWIPGNNISCPTQEGQRFREQIDYSGSAGIQIPLISKSPAQSFPSRSSNSEVVLRPYRARRIRSSHLVKLAPDLPPVNLPPSVRVISQAAFRNSRGESSMKVSGNALRANDTPENARSTTKPGIHYPTKSGQSRRNSMKITDANQCQEHSNVSNKCVVDSGGDADLQMHPLLFQSLRDGDLPYYPLAHDNSTSSFALFSGKQPHLSLSLFHNPRHIKDAVNFLSNSSKILDKDVSSSTHFHPLLRRTDEVDTDSAGGLFSEEARQKSQNLPSYRNGPVLDNNSPRFMGHGGKINGGLDLDIHLNLTSEKQRALRSCSGPLSTPSTGIAERGEVSDMHNDESLPGIIMEQEELSDSDEELGENVEFEREEMADSEGDSTSDSEQFVNIASELPNTRNDHEGNSSVAVSNADVKPLNLNFCPVSPHSRTTNVMPGQDSQTFGMTFTSDSKEYTKPGKARALKRSNGAGECSDETLLTNSRKRSWKSHCSSSTTASRKGASSSNMNTNGDKFD